MKQLSHSSCSFSRSPSLFFLYFLHLFILCVLFQFCLFFFLRFEPFSLSFRFGVRALCVGLPDTSPTWSALHFWNPLTYVCTLPGYWVAFLWCVENKPYLTVGPNRSLQGFAFVKLWLPQGACETEHTFSVSDTRPTTRKGHVVRHCSKYLPMPYHPPFFNEILWVIWNLSHFRSFWTFPACAGYQILSEPLNLQISYMFA